MNKAVRPRFRAASFCPSKVRPVRSLFFEDAPELRGVRVAVAVKWERRRPWISSIDAAIPAASCFWARVIRVDDALGGAARCRHIALCQRGIGAFEVIVFPALVDLQADRIVRIIRLGPSRRRCRSHPNCKNRQRQNAHQNLFSGPCPARDTALQLAQQQCPTSVPVADLPASHSQRMGARELGDGDIADIAAVGSRRLGPARNTFFTWCGRWDSNPHDVAIEGF